MLHDIKGKRLHGSESMNWDTILPPTFGHTYVAVSEPPTPLWKRICERLRIRVVQVVGGLKRCLSIQQSRIHRFGQSIRTRDEH